MTFQRRADLGEIFVKVAGSIRSFLRKLFRAYVLASITIVTPKTPYLNGCSFPSFYSYLTPFEDFIQLLQARDFDDGAVLGEPGGRREGG